MKQASECPESDISDDANLRNTRQSGKDQSCNFDRRLSRRPTTGYGFDSAILLTLRNDVGILKEMQRAHARQVRAQKQAKTAAYRQHQQLRREAEHAMKAAQRASAADQRERKRLHAEARLAEVSADNSGLQSRLEELDNLLTATLEVDDYIDLGRLRKAVEHPPFAPGSLGNPLPQPDWRRFEPPAPSSLSKMFGGQARYQQQLAVAQHAFGQAQQQYAVAEANRQQRLSAAHQRYLQRCAKADAEAAAHNAELDRFAALLAAAEPAAVVEYFGMVLGNSVYPDDFPQHYRLAFVPESRQLVVEYHLPTLDVIPAAREYRYVKARDEITTTVRSAKEVKERYAKLVAQVTLRTVHELFEADRTGIVGTIVFNGIVDTTDPRTGTSVQPCLVTLRTHPRSLHGFESASGGTPRLLTAPQCLGVEEARRTCSGTSGLGVRHG
ncbi:hypothetical protein ACN28G_02500 [Micromonospora sp. WMMA1923]|uniref:hypothetical protein n=1 Tax=Micromonospora sp. WMMA1923 TaxID=3404125 RepID=UPI003B932789